MQRPKEDETFPDTEAGVRDCVKTLYNDSVLKKLKLNTCTVQADPMVAGVWKITSADKTMEAIVYLKGYNDPWGKLRTFNDSEENF